MQIGILLAYLFAHTGFQTQCSWSCSFLSRLGSFLSWAAFSHSHSSGFHDSVAKSTPYVPSKALFVPPPPQRLPSPQMPPDTPHQYLGNIQYRCICSLFAALSWWMAEPVDSLFSCADVHTFHSASSVVFVWLSNANTHAHLLYCSTSSLSLQCLVQQKSLNPAKVQFFL